METQHAAQGQIPIRRRRSRLPLLIFILVILILIVAAAIGIYNYIAAKKYATIYQAVFLTNGQVYFGHLTHADSNYLVLTDIYYLQVNQPLQSGQNTQQAASSASPQLSLVKLGNELHGPMDIMYINRPQVLFFEDLKNDGKVVQAINSYKANGSSPTAAGTGSTNQAAPVTNSTIPQGTGLTGTTPQQSAPVQ